MQIVRVKIVGLIVLADEQKDMTEWKIIKKLIPQAGLLICLFHTMCSCKRESTTEKMGISVNKRLQVLEIIQSMANAPTEEVYQELYDQVMGTRFSAVKEYFIENWHSIRS